MHLPKRAVSESKLGSPPRGGEMEESAFPQQQPIFMGGKLPLKSGLLLEATRWLFRALRGNSFCGIMSVL